MTDKSGCLLSLRVLMRSLRQRTFYLKKKYKEEVYGLAHKVPHHHHHQKKENQAQDINLFHGLNNKTVIHSNGVIPWLLFYATVSRIFPTERTMIGFILFQVRDILLPSHAFGWDFRKIS